MWARRRGAGDGGRREEPEEEEEEKWGPVQAAAESGISRSRETGKAEQTAAERQAGRQAGSVIAGVRTFDKTTTCLQLTTAC